MKPTYILLGADGYYGRNFQFYLSELDYCFIAVDKNIPDDFYSSFPIENHLLDYIRCDLSDKDCVKKITSLIEFFKDEVIIVNFAAISFVDYSIIHPEETINNNVKCCINGYKLSKHFNSKYIYISTDEVRVNKEENDLSPYVISKKRCEEFLKSQPSDKIYILRPVNLMDVIASVKGLKQRQRCLLNNIADSILSKSSVKLHVGTQKRMFMSMRTACDLLIEIDDYVPHSYPEEDDLTKIVDVVDIPSLRTSDLPIHDIVYFLHYVYRFKVDEVPNPRGVYQDESYLNVYGNVKIDEKWNINSYKMILNAVEKILKIKMK